MSSIRYKTRPDLGISSLRELQEVPPQTKVDAYYVYPFSGGPINYEIIEGDFPPGITLDSETGYISGIVPEMDDWVDEFIQAIPEYTHENYATAGSAALFSGSGLTGSYPTTYISTFVVRAYDSLRPTTVYTDETFFFRLRNNWSSDRDRFINRFDWGEGNSLYALNGKLLSGFDYLKEMKLLGYFN